MGYDVLRAAGVGVQRVGLRAVRAGAAGVWVQVLI